MRKDDSRKRQNEFDEEGYKKRHAKLEQARKKRRKETDEKGFNKLNKEAVQACQKRQKETDEKGFKKKKKIANKKNNSRIRSSRAAAVKKFYQETLYGPVFECVCCRTLNFKHNVVGFNKQIQTQILKKAEDAHTKDYNSKLEKVNISVLVNS